MSSNDFTSRSEAFHRLACNSSMDLVFEFPMSSQLWPGPWQCTVLTTQILSEHPETFLNISCVQLSLVILGIPNPLGSMEPKHFSKQPITFYGSLEKAKRNDYGVFPCSISKRNLSQGGRGVNLLKEINNTMWSPNAFQRYLRVFCKWKFALCFKRWKIKSRGKVSTRLYKGQGQELQWYAN